MIKRVVITGRGTISSSGKNAEELWTNVSNGISGIKKIEAEEFSNLEIRIGGVISDYAIDQYLNQKEIKRTDRFTHFSVISSMQALSEASFDHKDFDLEKCGVMIGTGIGGIHSLIENQNIMEKKGSNRVSPLVVPKSIGNIAGGFVSIKTGFKDVTLCPISACASGNQAIGEAFLRIKYGLSEAILAGGAEASIVPIAFAGYNQMQALSTRNEQPNLASKPFDKNRDGFVMSEGAGIVFLEEFEHARSRGAKILGEIIGYGMTSDAYHMTTPHSEGASRAIQKALEMGKISANEIDYINAHATGTKVGDISESRAIKKVFGKHAEQLLISSTKSSTGHLLGAAGGIEAVISLKAMEYNILPPTINLTEPDKDCDLNYIPNNKIHHQANIILSNGFGFGGHNTSIIIRKL
ncbi:beta-ketoacyl-ACP synthase II [Enterococcus hirae]|uniref:beta-ketoacyl-ACP synthase II n=1 Tax=Enterococcus hirae TaxID=1354 RepID=UPI001929AD3C|nr:beta-ketoacyl-ACP synthase II [Enterococcus hirae]NBA55540.1 beta-ketoacyl-ACP synthase II [Enterococcus hirae]